MRRHLLRWRYPPRCGKRVEPPSSAVPISSLKWQDARKNRRQRDAIPLRDPPHTARVNSDTRPLSAFKVKRSSERKATTLCARSGLSCRSMPLHAVQTKRLEPFKDSVPPKLQRRIEVELDGSRLCTDRPPGIARRQPWRDKRRVPRSAEHPTRRSGGRSCGRRGLGIWYDLLRDRPV